MVVVSKHSMSAVLVDSSTCTAETAQHAGQAGVKMVAKSDNFDGFAEIFDISGQSQNRVLDMDH